MPPFKRTNIYKAAEAAELVAEGKSTYQAGKLVGLPQRTVHDIIAGKHNWKQIGNDPLFREHRLQVKRGHQLALNEIASKAMVQVEDTLDKASAYQAMMIAAISIDKERLLAGEATSHVAVVTVEETKARERAIEALLASMLPLEVESAEAESGHGKVEIEEGHVQREDAKSNT